MASSAMRYCLWWRRWCHLALWHCELHNISKCSWHFLNGVFLHLSEGSFNGLRCKYVSWKILTHTLPLSKVIFFSRVFLVRIHNTFQRMSFLYTLFCKIHDVKCYTSPLQQYLKVQIKQPLYRSKKISLINSRRRLKPILLLPLCIAKQFLKCRQLMRLHA